MIEFDGFSDLVEAIRKVKVKVKNGFVSIKLVVLKTRITKEEIGTFKSL